MPLPVDIGVAPIAQSWAGVPVHMRFVDNGTLTVRVHASPVTLDTSKGQCVSHADSAVKVTPDVFTVTPHHGQTVSVTVPGSGAHDYGVLFIADALTGSKGKPVVVQAAVGSEVTTNGHLACGGKHTLAAATPAGFSPVSAALIAFGICAVLLIALGAVLRRNHARRS